MIATRQHGKSPREHDLAKLLKKLPAADKDAIRQRKHRLLIDLSRRTCCPAYAEVNAKF